MRLLLCFVVRDAVSLLADDEHWWMRMWIS